MDRLTFRDESGAANLERSPSMWADIYEKLAEYEDLEEQGRLIKLPELSFGQDVWIIYKGKIKHLKVTGFNFKPYGFPAKEIIPMKQGHFQIVLTLSGFTWGCMIEDIGKTVFLTKGEAEKALEDMKNA